MREAVFYEKVEGLGVTFSMKVSLSPEEEEFFKQLLKKYERVELKNPPYPTIVKTYYLLTTQQS